MNIPFDHKGIDEEPKGVTENSLSRTEMTFDDWQRLVGAFVWLLQEDKKQNPKLYFEDCSEKRCGVQSR